MITLLANIDFFSQDNKQYDTIMTFVVFYSISLHDVLITAAQNLSICSECGYAEWALSCINEILLRKMEGKNGGENWRRKMEETMEEKNGGEKWRRKMEEKNGGEKWSKKWRRKME